MPDNETHHTSGPAQPAPARAPSLTDAEANRQLGQGQVPHAVDAPEAAQEPLGTTQGSDPAAPDGDRTVKVGARDIVRPSNEDDGAQGGAGTVYDRLAKKDNTNAGPGGDSGAA